MKHVGRTKPFRGPGGRIVPGSIAEVTYLRLGGIDQWVMIRGESLANPPLILLHGGPGMSEARFFRRFNAALERCFTVVNWDQRGTGKSFDSSIPASTMNVEQFVSDLAELVEWVCERTGHRKVVLYGHSWGSAFGVLYAHRFPHRVSAYVGTGQGGDWAAGERISYAWALAEAERQHNAHAVAALREIGPPPHTVDQLMTQRTWLARLEGYLRPGVLWDMGRIFLAGPEFSLLDLPSFWRGFRFSLESMWAEVGTVDLRKQAPQLAMPVFFFLGRQDHWVPPEASMAWIEMLEAPSKRIVWFDQSGHEPFMDEAEKFNERMVTLVRPVAVEAEQSQHAA